MIESAGKTNQLNRDGSINNESQKIDNSDGKSYIDEYKDIAYLLLNLVSKFENKICLIEGTSGTGKTVLARTCASLVVDSVCIDCSTMQGQSMDIKIEKNIDLIVFDEIDGVNQKTIKSIIDRGLQDTMIIVVAQCKQDLSQEIQDYFDDKNTFKLDTEINNNVFFRVPIEWREDERARKMHTKRI